MIPAIHDSKKITGLVIVLAALIVLAIVAIIGVAVFGIGESLFAQIGATMGLVGGAHQGGQAAVDRAAAQQGTYRSTSGVTPFLAPLDAPGAPSPSGPRIP